MEQKVVPTGRTTQLAFPFSPAFVPFSSSAPQPISTAHHAIFSSYLRCCQQTVGETWQPIFSPNREIFSDRLELSVLNSIISQLQLGGGTRRRSERYKCFFFFVAIIPTKCNWTCPSDSINRALVFLHVLSLQSPNINC